MKQLKQHEIDLIYVLGIVESLVMTLANKNDIGGADYILRELDLIYERYIEDAEDRGLRELINYMLEQ